MPIHQKYETCFDSFGEKTDYAIAISCILYPKETKKKKKKEKEVAKERKFVDVKSILKEIQLIVNGPYLRGPSTS